MFCICCLLVSACKVSSKVRSFSISRSFNFRSLSPKSNLEVTMIPLDFFASVFSAPQNSSTVSCSRCLLSKNRCLLKFFDVSGSQCSLNLFSTTSIVFVPLRRPDKIAVNFDTLFPQHAQQRGDLNFLLLLIKATRYLVQVSAHFPLPP